MTTSLPYKPEIDGLRSIAVLAIIIFHAKKTLIPGGYLGVDVFFVISGFLITSIIIRETANGGFSLAKFWARRIKRILPAATFVLFIVSLVQIIFMYRPDLFELSNQKFSALFSFANIYFWRNIGDYWGAASEESPFIHYWSLSLEEQYYLFFPILMLAFIGKRKKYLVSVLILLIIISLAAFSYGAVYHPYATFFLLPTRIWQLGAGCLLAVLPNNIPFTNRSAGTIIGLLLIGLTYFFPTNHSGIGYESFVVVVGSCLTIWSGSNKVSRLILQNRLAIFIGQISFSLYLWHWPIIVTLKNIRNYNYITSDVTLVVSAGIALLMLSLISYYFIEKPFRRQKHGVAIVLGFAAIVGLYFYAIEPNIIRKPYLSQYETPSWYGRYYDLRPSNDMSGAFEMIVNSVHAPKREASVTAYKEGGIIRQRSSADVKVVLIGDSHAIMWSKVVDGVTKDLDLTTSLWSMNAEDGIIHVPAIEQASGSLTKKERFDYDAQRYYFIKNWNPDILIVSNRWEIINEDSINAFLNFLELHAKNVILVESPPVLQGVGNRSAYQYFSFLGMDTSLIENSNQFWKQAKVEDVIKTREKLLKIVSEHPNFHFLPVADLFLSDSFVIAASGKQVHYLDDDHLTDEGAKLVASRFRSSIANILNGKRNVFPIVSDQGPEGRQVLRETTLPGSK